MGVVIHYNILKIFHFQVPLGVIKKDETKTKEMAEVLQELRRYVPVDANGEQLPVVLYGDGLSCERVKDAQESCGNATLIPDKLQCFEPVPQEWHKRLLYVTVRNTYINVHLFIY